MTFDTAFDRLMLHEGGYVNDPNDPGGETKWGISKRAYPTIDIANLGREVAKMIYRRDFYLPVHADEMLFALGFQVFDFAVNSGVATAIRYLQRALSIADDGVWGPVTRSAVERADADTVMRLLSLRLDLMSRLLHWPVHGRGWSRRIAQNLIYAAEDT